MKLSSHIYIYDAIKTSITEQLIPCLSTDQTTLEKLSLKVYICIANYLIILCVNLLLLNEILKQYMGGIFNNILNKLCQIHGEYLQMVLIAAFDIAV